MFDSCLDDFPVHLPFLWYNLHRYLRSADGRLSVESLLVDSLFSLYVGDLNVELAQCRQLIV